jgi:hypothetical protein
VGETLAGLRARARIATQVNAQSHAVPASAAPTWMPPTWVHLRDAPSEPQRPGTRAAAGQSKQHVEDLLLAYENRRGQVHEREGRERRQGTPIGDQPVAAIEVVPEHPEIDQHDGENQPVVRHEARMLEQAHRGVQELVWSSRHALAR